MCQRPLWMLYKKKILFLFVVLIGITGCSHFQKFFDKNARTEEKQRQKLIAAQDAVKEIDKEKLGAIARFASGTDYALGKSTNDEPTTLIARELNFRVISLSGEPTLDEKKAIWDLVDKLTSDLIEERIKGRKLLEKQDILIKVIQQNEVDKIAAEKEAIDKYVDVAGKTAKNADINASELREYESFWGLAAIKKGATRFLTRSFWFLVGFGIVFIILRFAAGTNPIVGAIFSLFEQIGSWVIHCVRILLPKAINFAHFVPQAEFNDYKNTLKDIIHCVQKLKTNNVDNRSISLDDLLNDLDRKLDTEDKKRIDIIKSELNWK